MKELTTREIAAVKRQFKNSLPAMKKIESIDLITCTYEPQFNEDGTPKMDKEGKYQVKNQVLTFHAPVEVPSTEGKVGSDFDVDSEAKVEENETTAADAVFNPLEGLE